MEDLREVARLIFDRALSECSIDRAFDRTMRTEIGAGGIHLLLGGEPVAALDRLRQVRVVAAGKAAAAMLTSLLGRLELPPECYLEAVLISGECPPNLPPGVQFFSGGHPVPNQNSFAGADAALQMLRSISNAETDEAMCIFLISGGASSMMELPLDPTISLEDTIAFHQALVLSGASIVEINCVRKHFSAVKGGRLALAAGNAQTISLFVSDVPPAHLDALGSGPTLPDPTTIAECHEIFARYGLLERFPESVHRFFTAPTLPESPKPGRLNARSWKLLDSDELADLARRHAVSLGFHAVIDNTCDDFNYEAAAEYLLDRLRRLRREYPRVCLLSAGEVTVKVPSQLSPETSHIGGRNQHFALYLATRLRPDDGSIAVLSAGSDGIDGNSLAAGAVIDRATLDGGFLDAPLGADIAGSSISRLASAQRALEQFDSSTWLSDIGATIITGPTGHNLRDLRILLAT